MNKEHRELIEDWVDANPFKARAYRNAIIEECARVAESNGFSLTVAGGAVGATIAAAIRALRGKP